MDSNNPLISNTTATDEKTALVAAALAAQKSNQQPSTTTPIVSNIQQQPAASSSTTASLPQYHVNPYSAAQQMGAQGVPGSKYQHLLAFIEELGKDIRPTYNGSRNCQERLKRGIVQARLMLRECMAELEQNRKQGGGGGGLA